MPRQVNCVFLELSFSLFDHIQWLVSSIVVYTTQDAWKLLDNVVRWRVYVGWVVSAYELAPTLAHQQWTTGSWQAQVNCPAVLCRRHLSTLSSTGYQHEHSVSHQWWSCWSMTKLHCEDRMSREASLWGCHGINSCRWVWQAEKCNITTICHQQ